MVSKVTVGKVDITLLRHFVWYTLLVLGWIPYCIQNCLISFDLH